MQTKFKQSKCLTPAEQEYYDEIRGMLLKDGMASLINVKPTNQKIFDMAKQDYLEILTNPYMHGRTVYKRDL
jgi:hypothetical protein